MDVLITASLSEDVRRLVNETVQRAGAGATFEKDLRQVSVQPDVIFGNVSVDFALEQPKLRWVQTVSAGIDAFSARADEIPEELLITNGSGTYGPGGGDHVMAMMLFFTRALGTYWDNKKRGLWQPRLASMSRLLGQRLVVLGLGDLGLNVARRAKAFGMYVIGVKRTPEHVAEVDEVVTVDEIERVLPGADHVAITLPHTNATRHLLSRERLALLPPTAYLYNIGRGAVVDEDALVEALQSGRLAGAGLDVFTTEPLPEEHPFWAMENVLITPHVGANTPHDHDIAAEIFLQNWQRFVAGEPLMNRVDLQLGY